MQKEHPRKTEESANQLEGCDAKLKGPDRAASCTSPEVHHSVTPAFRGRCGAFLHLRRVQGKAFGIHTMFADGRENFIKHPVFKSFCRWQLAVNDQPVNITF